MKTLNWPATSSLSDLMREVRRNAWTIIRCSFHRSDDGDFWQVLYVEAEDDPR